MRTPASVRFVTPLALTLAFAAAAARADVVIPSTVYRRGAGGAEFRSDVRVLNPTASPINYTPVLYDQVSGQTLTAPLQTIPARTQQSFDNIVGTLFGKTLVDGAFGPIRFQTSGAILVSSSVNNYNACGNGAISGQWLPGLDATAAVKAGTLVQLASSVDLNSGYRTNVVFTNPGTQPAIVTAKVRKGDGSQVSSATLDPLGANGFVQIGNWGSFPGVAGTADTNLWLEHQRPARPRLRVRHQQRVRRSVRDCHDGRAERLVAGSRRLLYRLRQPHDGPAGHVHRHVLEFPRESVLGVRRRHGQHDDDQHHDAYVLDVRDVPLGVLRRQCERLEQRDQRRRRGGQTPVGY